MKTIFSIAKNEMRNLFYSPVAWFVLIVFLVMCAFFYTGITYPAVKALYPLLKDHYAVWNAVAGGSVTAGIFSSFFLRILPHLYLFVPLLTMGIISREKTGETIRLLYSSPITLTQIVLGKYLALMIYYLSFIFIIGIFIISGFFDIRYLDLPSLLAACLGLYLLLCAFGAIGFFMSSLTAYQIVSAIASFTLLFVLSVIAGLWQQFGFMRELTRFISISGRTEKMLSGLIRSKDILYYLLIIYLFVSFTLLKLKAGRNHIPWYMNSGKYLFVIVTGLLIGYIGSLPRYTIYWDTTAIKSNTLNPKTQEVLKEFEDSSLDIILYDNLFDKSAPVGFPSARNAFLDMWEPYIRFRPDIKFKYVYYYDVMPGDSSLYYKFPHKTLQQIAGLMAKVKQVDSALFKSPEEMHKIINLQPENYLLAIQLKYKENTTFLRSVPSQTGIDLDQKSTEPQIIAAFKRVLGAKMPKIAFVTGELERNIYKRGEREYSNVIDSTDEKSLVNLGFNSDTLNLSMQDIPDDIDILALADPKMDLSPIVLAKLKRYVDSGGNMLIFGEPGKQYVLNPFLQQLGISLADGQLVQINKNETPDKVTSSFTPAYLDFADEPIFRVIKPGLPFMSMESLGGITKMDGVSSISRVSDSGFNVKSLLVTLSGKSWLKVGKLVTDSAPPVFNMKEGDIKVPSFPIALALSRKISGKEQRIAVYGDADIASNRGWSLNYKSFLTRAVYSWLDYNRFPVYTFPPAAKDNLLLLALKPGWAAAQKIIYVWVLPAILLIIGAVLLIRRKRQ